jgi:outer membrane protein OmpA-like peptidoglycan-associated protein
MLSPTAQRLLTRSAIFLVLMFAPWPRPQSALATLSLAEREEISDIPQSPPSMDLEINFGYRSAKISVRSSALVALEMLGQALTNPDLKDNTFIVAGHSAVEGRPIYDLNLSERRAKAVKRFLEENYDIPPDQLIAVGYGSSRLKNPDNPFADENQRVQIVNAGKADRK